MRSYLTLLLCFLIAVSSASAGEISYQGRLTDPTGEPVTNGIYSVTFLLYDDATAGNIVWAETAEITTNLGLFDHLLGSTMPLSDKLFQTYANLYLELRLNNQPITPRTKLASTPYASSASSLKGIDSSGTLSIVTDNDRHSLTMYKRNGDTLLTFQDTTGNNAVILPNFSISSEEILDEPGLGLDINSALITLSTSEMTDLVDLTIITPDDGYIVLYGKCYFLLSGTTGPNSAIVQIDENEGGGPSFPYYTIAGLSGYANSGTNYFPAFVTRVYYKSKGQYTFRLEGKASNETPAVAQTWDHVLMAAYYPTSYAGVKSIETSPMGDPTAIPLIIESNSPNRSSGTYYKVDLQKIELISKEKSEK